MSTIGGAGMGGVMPLTRVLCRRGALALGLLLALPLAHGEALEQLRAFVAQTQSAQGRFEQTAPAPHTPGGASGKAQVTQGRFSFQRPGRFRWDTERPYAQHVVSDGQMLYLYDPDLNQVTERRVAGAMPASPAAILFGASDLEREFTLQAEAPSGGLEWVLATPRQKDGAFEWIRIGFRDGLPAAMVLRDGFGQSTRLRFEQVTRNPALGANAFHFVIPQGADVLRE
jgi:outer membrane lipoprotein carrier protein